MSVVRSAIVAVALILVATTARAQQAPTSGLPERPGGVPPGQPERVGGVPSCPSVSPVRVIVTTTTGPSIQGTLLCLTGTEVVLATDGQVTTTALSAVRRIDTRPDPVWDGAVKGAILPLVMWAVMCHGCDAEPMLRAAAGYAVIGAVWDSLDTNQKRLYNRRPAAAIAWRLRF